MPLGARGARLAVASIAAAALAAASSAGAQVARPTTGPCPPAHARVLGRSSSSVAYRIRYEAYFCHEPTRRRYDMGDLASDPRSPESSCFLNVDLLRVAGRYGAWAQADFCHADQLYHVYRMDLATGKPLRGEPTGSSSCPQSQPSCGGVGIGPATGLVLDSRASIAWIAAGDGTTEVWRLDGRGRRRLAAGSDIDRKSLKRRRHAVEWRQAGVVHRASLRP